MALELVDVAEAVDGFVSDVDPACWQGSDAAVAVREIQRLENLLAGVRLAFVARVAATNGWSRDRGATGGAGDAGEEARSAADWLRKQSGIGAGEARKQIEAAKKVANGELPGTEAALRDGTITPSQAARIAEGAGADPDAEKELVAAAKSGDAGTLARAVDEAKQRSRDDRETHEQARRNRRVRFNTRDGAFWFDFLHTSDVGARVLARLIPLRDQIVRNARAHGHRISLEQANADAVAVLLLDLDPADIDELHEQADDFARQQNPSPEEAADDTLFGHEADLDEDSDDETRDDTVDDPDDDADDGDLVSAESGWGLSGLDNREARTRRQQRQARDRASRCKVIVRIDHEALRRGHTEAGEVCEIAGVGPVPVAAIRALLPDAFVAAVVTDGHDVKSVAHLGRRFTALQETVIEFRQPVCARCGNRARLEKDHVVPHVDSKRTTTDSAQHLCDRCHGDKSAQENRARTRTPGREPPDPRDPTDSADEAIIDLRDPTPPPSSAPGGDDADASGAAHRARGPRPDIVNEMIRRARAATSR